MKEGGRDTGDRKESEGENGQQTDRREREGGGEMDRKRKGREREEMTERPTDRQTDRGRENSNSKTLFYKDCSSGSVKTLTTSPC